MMLLRFVLGAVMGSVANAVIYRLPHKLRWWQGKSLCPRCKHQLQWLDLVPVVSFLILRGRCRYCHKPIAIRYLAVELLMIGGFVWLATSLLWALWFVTIIIAVMDWETMLVSDWLVGMGIILALVLNWPPTINTLWGVVVAVGLIGSIWALFRSRAMGFGDVEIAALLGLWLGWPKTAYALWIAFVSGAIVGVYYLLKGQKKLKSQLAFGPFLLLGSWLAYLVQWSHVLPF